MDGHTSHTRNIELIDLAQDHVHLLLSPPHSSNKIQPLERTFMGPHQKKYFTEEIRQFVGNKQQSANHFDIAEIFGRAYIRAQCAELAINGFRVTGICPINVFDDHEFYENNTISMDPIEDHMIHENCEGTEYVSDRTICGSPSLLTQRINHSSPEIDLVPIPQLSTDSYYYPLNNLCPRKKLKPRRQ